MKKKLKGFYIFLTSVFIYLFHLPLTFGRSSSNHPFPSTISAVKSAFSDPMGAIPGIRSVYDSLQLSITGLSSQAFEYARKGLEKLIEHGRILNDSIISIVDFSQASDKKRFYVIDLKNCRLLFNTLVAHGRNSGLDKAYSFSNQKSSMKSSPGFYITGEAYSGHNGYSLRLDGIEKGINDNAYARSIVVHGAAYVSESFLAASGHLGRSEGCPALPSSTVIPVIDQIKDKTCFFIYDPEEKYVRHSAILRNS